MIGVNVFIYFGGVETDVTGRTFGVTIRRGRSRELDTFTSGQATITLRNEDRAFDPLHQASPYYGELRPRIRVRVTSGELSLFDGFVEDWNYTYDQGNQSVAVVTCIDGLALLSQTALESFTNTQDTPAERIERIIGRDEVQYAGGVNLDPGLAILQPDTVTDNTNTLGYLQQVADTDLGRLFVDGNGDLRYRDRTSGVVELPRVIFANTDDEYVQQLALLSTATLWFDASTPEPVRLDSDGIAQTILQDAVLWFDASDPSYVAPVIGFNGVEIEYGSEFLFNRVTVERNGGSTFRVIDTASQGRYGLRTLTQTGLLFLTDDETEQYGLYLLGLYREPNVRVASHSIALHGVSDLHRRYLQRLEIGDVVRTIWTPNNVGNAIDVDSIIEGIEHTVTAATHTVRFQLTPFSRDGFILDDDNRGILDTSIVRY